MAVASKTVEIAPGIVWVGSEDFQRRLFDSLIPLPYGTSYNAYLVMGSEKVALIDTVNPGFEEELLAKVASVVDPASIDYLVMNHAEPDHANAIPRVLEIAPRARLVATRRGVEMAGLYFGVPEEKRIAVRQDDTVDLGGKTLRFIEAPMLHWPETMFTFAVEDQVLFPCDFFGSHIASDRLFDDEVGDIVIPEAKRYYAEIMMPFLKPVQTGLQKASALEPRIIAPSHGPVYRNPQRILRAYERWAVLPLKPKAVVAYVSMWGTTEKMARAITASLSAEGIETVPYDLVTSDVGYMAADLVDASALVLGSPTVIGGPHPVASYALTLVGVLKPRLKLAAFFGSYGWGGGAARQAQAALEPRQIELVDVLDVKGPANDKVLKQAAELGRKVARRIRESLV